jgi:RNA polymerase primary sigma factor
MRIPPPSDNSPSAYLEEVAKMPTLNAEEERDLFQRLGRGEPGARRRIVEANLWLVARLASRMTKRGLALGDLIQEGNLALLKAVDNFDGERGCRFSTYAALWIRGAMREAARNASLPLSAPTRAARRSDRMLSAMARERDATGREASRRSLAESLGVDEAEIVALLALRSTPASLDAVLDSGDEAWIDKLPAAPAPGPREAIYRRQLAAVARRALAEVLSERERRVLELRFGLSPDADAIEGAEEHSLRGVGRLAGLSGEGARRVEARALKKLRACPQLAAWAME